MVAELERTPVPLLIVDLSGELLKVTSCERVLTVSREHSLQDNHLNRKLQWRCVIDEAIDEMAAVKIKKSVEYRQKLMHLAWLVVWQTVLMPAI